MKKLILGLFMILVASSYAVPSFVNSKRAEERGYKIVSDSEGTISMQKVDDESATTISYWYGFKNPDVAELNKILKGEKKKGGGLSKNFYIIRPLVPNNENAQQSGI